ncbi:MAG TPA: GxxExxY protein [Gemmatimonadaceae bacterium]|jgi:hypothetical protein
MRDLDHVTGQIVDAAVKVHRALGPGLFESVYETILARELERRGMEAERQKIAGFDFDGIHFERGLRLDLLVDGIVAVELKSVEQIMLVHKVQLLTYIRLLQLPVGLLINFGGVTLKEGLHRLFNDRLPPQSPNR